MTFEDKLRINKQAYYSAKEGNKTLNIEVSTRNNSKNILVGKYDKSVPPNKAKQHGPSGGTR